MPRFAYRNIAGGHVPYKLSLHQEIGPNEYGKVINFEKDDFGKNVSNLDVLKRLSQLEKIVYGKDE